MKYIIVLLMGVLLVGCSGGSTEIVIKLDLDIPENYVISIMELTDEGMNPLDTFALSGEKEYRVKIKPDGEQFYRIDVARKRSVNLVLTEGNEDVIILFNGYNKIIDGSDVSAVLIEMDESLAGYQTKAEGARRRISNVMESGVQSEVDRLTEEYNRLTANQLELLKDQITRSGASLAALYGLNYLDMDTEFSFFDEVVNRVKADKPDHWWVQRLDAEIEARRRLAIGAEAPDFSLPTPDGEELALSDLRGKYVLIDFWAAWCRPCRVENPNVVRAYNRFSSYNFEILGVSLDRTRESWLKAIEDDGLPWKHVSDLQYYNSAAARLYEINAIPATYLIDPEGKIIAKNLRGPSLDAKLSEIFEN